MALGVLGWCCRPASVTWATRAEEMEEAPLPSLPCLPPFHLLLLGAPVHG